MHLVALFGIRLPGWKCRALAEFDGLATRGEESEATNVERHCRLPVATIGHDGGQSRPHDSVEQFLLIGRLSRPDSAEVLDGVDVWNDRVMARALRRLAVEGAARTF